MLATKNEKTLPFDPSTDPATHSCISSASSFFHGDGELRSGQAGRMRVSGPSNNRDHGGDSRERCEANVKGRYETVRRDEDIRHVDVAHTTLHRLLAEVRRKEEDLDKSTQRLCEEPQERDDEAAEEKKRARQRRAILLPAAHQTLPEPEELTVGVPKERLVVRNDFLGLYRQHDNNTLDFAKLLDVNDQNGEVELSEKVGIERGKHGTAETASGYAGSGIIPLRGLRPFYREGGAREEDFGSRTRNDIATDSAEKGLVRATFPPAASRLPIGSKDATATVTVPSEVHAETKQSTSAMMWTHRYSQRASMVEFRHCWCSYSFIMGCAVFIAGGLTIWLLYGLPSFRYA